MEPDIARLENGGAGYFSSIACSSMRGHVGPRRVISRAPAPRRFADTRWKPRVDRDLLARSPHGNSRARKRVSNGPLANAGSIP
jgi:hypothetical protein